MADAPPTSSAPAEGAAGTFASRLVAAVTLLVPTAGLAWHAWAYLALEAEVLRAYLRGPWLKAAALVAFVNPSTWWPPGSTTGARG